jgi:adenine/guanine phosphoribosyltransferase-like PRPP-binding protein
MKPPRVPLYDFPDVVLHAQESAAKGHAEYQAAKGGDLRAADVLTSQLVSSVAVEQLAGVMEGRSIELVPIHALESGGVNEIPAALATVLSRLLGLPVNKSIVQLNSVGHTGAGGFKRLANQALFSGAVVRGQWYFVVDDFVGQGGTLANLIGFIRSQGGQVLGATVLTGRPYSAKLAPDEPQIQALRAKHGPDLEEWWQQNFGFGFECLTRSEARYLDNTADAQTIRDRLAEAGFAGGT